MKNTYGTYSDQESNLTYEVMMEAMAKMAELPVAPPLRIITNSFLTEIVQYKFPKKKSNRRWAKKFKKKYTKEMPSTKGYLIKESNMFICHPAMENTVINQLKRLEGFIEGE